MSKGAPHSQPYDPDHKHATHDKHPLGIKYGTVPYHSLHSQLPHIPDYYPITPGLQCQHEPSPAPVARFPRPRAAALPPSDPSHATAGPTPAPPQRLGPHAHAVRVDVLLEAVWDY